MLLVALVTRHHAPSSSSRTVPKPHFNKHQTRKYSEGFDGCCMMELKQNPCPRRECNTCQAGGQTQNGNDVSNLRAYLHC
jgi:hypothetical protein